MNEPRLFPTHARYRLLFVASVLVAALLAWNLGQGLLGTPAVDGVSLANLALDQGDWGNLLFLLLTLAIATFYARAMSSTVELTPAGVTLRTRFGPIGRARHVDFRQITGASESGRLGSNLTLIYHPLRADGLVDGDDVRGLTLPGVVDQDALLDAIVRRAAL